MNNEQEKNKAGQLYEGQPSSPPQEKDVSPKQSQDSSVGGRNIRNKK